MSIYRTYAESCRGAFDLVVIGHVHTPADLVTAGPRLIVLGGWQRRASYLKVDQSGAILHVEDDPSDTMPAAAHGRLPGSPHEVNRHES